MSAEPQDILAALMRGHGVPVSVEGDWLVAPDHPARIGAWIVQEREHDEAVIVQLDVRVASGDGRIVNESCAGVGADSEAATRDAMENFTRNALHVLLAAFWDQVHEDQVEIAHWAIGRETWRVILGPCTIRRMAPDPLTLPHDAFAQVKAAIEEAALTDELSWVRWFYCDNKAGAPMFEALINNDDWPEGVAALQEIDWPDVEHFWSVRQFLVLDRPRPA